jgi:DNA polymerase III subunit delta'
VENRLMLAPWQAALYQPSVAAFLAGRLGHAQLILGQAYLGKAALADALAQRLLCQRSDGDLDACGQCVSCQRLVQGSHGDFRRIGIELNEKTGKLKTAITVEQIRALSEWLSLTAQLSGPRVVIIETAHRMNTQAANALLKTLEEPMPGRFLLLLSDQPAQLPATVRSRCQRLQMGLPARAAALAWLPHAGVPQADAETLLDLAGGNPGLAAHWHAMGALAVHKSVHADLAACAKHRQSAVAVARLWLDDELCDLRLQFAAAIGLGLFRKRAMAAADAGQSADSAIKVQEWIDAVNRLRLSLSQPLRHDLALAALLVAWQQLFPEPR